MFGRNVVVVNELRGGSLKFSLHFLLLADIKECRIRIYIMEKFS